MFQIADNKVFMDSVHGYISVPKCFVEHIIDTRMFQRLRNIDQTGMRILYPTAKHDRFGHSLGVYYLGCRAVDALLDNFSKDAYWNISSDHKSVLFWAKNKLLFMIACLLHDIGHVPFSHSLESEVIDNSVSNRDAIQFKRELAQLIKDREKDKTEEVSVASIEASEHEQIGARYILEHLSDHIAAVYDDLIKDGYPNAEPDGILYAENYDGKILINKDTLDQDICFIARMILGLKYTDYLPEKQIKNCFIELLNSNNFDVDKLDYILRDTKMSGISNINVDIERLLGAISIVTKTIYKNGKNTQLHLLNDTIYELETAAGKSGDSICLSGELKGVIELHINAHVRIHVGSRFQSLDDKNARAKVNAEEAITYFSESTQIYQEGDEIKKTADGTPLYNNNGKPYRCVIKDAEIVGNKDYVFTVCDGTMELRLNGNCRIEIAGQCNLNGVLTTLGLSEITGSFKTLKILGDKLQNSIPDKNAYFEFNVGYTKQALNVIANVLEARDYLYLWIYAHHKVVYYANYLIPVLTKITLPKDLRRKVWKLNYRMLEKLDDSYVWTEIKRQEFTEGTREKELYDELFSRKYKCSIYKSLAEFDLLFQNISDENKMLVRSWFLERIEKDACCLDNYKEEKKAGYLSESAITELKEFAVQTGLDSIKYIKDIVFVEATYKAKPINPHNALIVMGDKITVMEEIPLLRDKSLALPKNTAYYFYLYYTVGSTCDVETAVVSLEMKELLRKFMTDYVSFIRKNQSNNQLKRC